MYDIHNKGQYHPQVVWLAQVAMPGGTVVTLRSYCLPRV